MSDMVISHVDSMESRGPEEGLESRIGSDAGLIEYGKQL